MLFRKPLHELDSRSQLPREDENVVSKSESSQLRHTFDEIFTHQKTIVWLSLRDMAKSAQLGKMREIFEPFVQAGRQEVHPTDNASNASVLFCKADQESRFVFGLVSLHGNRGFYAISR